MTERLAIAGSGAIACGLAATAAQHTTAMLWARSEESAQRARATVEKLTARLEGADPSRIEIHTDHEALHEATYVIEAVVENEEVKGELHGRFGDLLDEGAVLGSTTSSLSIEALARASGRAKRFVGFHVFNPVPRMELVELVFPPEADADTRARTIALCEMLGKTAIEVPDIPGFVVNRLLFPYLFDAVRLLEQTGMRPEDIDTCMRLGAGHPMGPLALLDLVGLDVARAIGEMLEEPIPHRIDELIAVGALGRKTKAGFHSYD